METLGFRLPQFSEDLAWLPGWVQHQVEEFGGGKEEPLGSSELKSKDSSLFQGHIFKGDDVILLSNEESRHNNHQLFLSGEDNPSSTFTSSSRNLLHFHLHLSSNGFSQWKPSQFTASDASQTLSKPDRVLSNNFETSFAVKDNSRSKMGFNPGGLNIPLECSKSEPHPNNPTKSSDSMKHCEETFILTRLRDAEMNDAVKLSIAASEALVIHEIAKTRLEIDDFPVADAIEVSLRLKQARLEWLDDAFSYYKEDSDDCESLSDLDEFAMSDAFEDVGLTYSTSDEHLRASTVSYVKETPASNDQDICKNYCEFLNDPAREEPKSDAMLAKDLPFVSLDDERLDNYLDDHISSISLTNMVAEIDQLAVKDSLAKDAEPMEINASPQFKQNNTNGVLKAFTCETSFLSESANIAPDESSFVQMPKFLSYGESQSSRAVETEKKDISLSQDLVRSSSLSLDDPLCSVVPCSVALGNVKSIEARHHNNMDIDLERDSKHVVDLKTENSSTIVGPEVALHGEDGKSIQIVDKVSKVSFRKHMTSLKTYSTLLPNIVSISGGLFRFKRSCRSDFASIRASDKGKHIKEPLGKETDTFCEPVEYADSIGIPTKKNASKSETARYERDSPVKSPKALPLNPRARRQLQCSKPSTVNFSRGKNPKRPLGTEDILFPQSEKSEKIKSAYKKPHDGNGPLRKRVRFSEAEAELMPSTSGQASSRGIPGSTVASSEKLNDTEKESDYHISEASFPKCYLSIGKVCLLQGMQFLLTGLSKPKTADTKRQIQSQGGIVLSHIPSVSNVRSNKLSRSDSYQLPVILSSKKQQTAKFLYGCAVNALILHVDWLTNSIHSRCLLPPEKYLILSYQRINGIEKQVCDGDCNFIFERVGIMLNGKHSFCTKLAKILKHGGGRVFKSLHRLVQSFEKGVISTAAIVTEDESTRLRHLKQCAFERQIPMLPASWIIKSLCSGKLQPFGE